MADAKLSSEDAERVQELIDEARSIIQRAVDED